ncbi:von Willebrand factor A domain-containing protein 3B-like isoform X2 [Alosa sapidissima]|uniref:von Willebrand factor A domain-containing protein 3B-like isoform X2 n=1 Tax=Alosa sapidissima TaxID=34773 RepID=UPI001C09EDE1|nr:von Willebrand factor A domain-containing protein 3B-like isoform X2 [Alosa sapidissima]
MCSDGERRDATQDHDLNTLISSAQWLSHYGLKQSKLTLSQILPTISFKHSEDYVHSLGKSVSSLYSCGMFPQFTIHGAVYNITASQHELEKVCTRLERTANQYQQRLNWLTTGSRQLFGVIQEKRVTVIVDLGSCPSIEHHQQAKRALSLVICEQVSQIDSFNIIHSGGHVNAWRERVVDTSEENLQSATDWLWALQPEASCLINTASALLKAMEDMNEAVYLFAAGDFWDEDIKDVLGNWLVDIVCPVHTISFNAKAEKTMLALKHLSFLSAGRFHAFAEISIFVDELCDSSLDKERCGASEVRTELLGGVPTGCGVREDVYLVWSEKRQALQIRDQIQAILIELFPPEPKSEPDQLCSCTSECSLSSGQWLELFGLKAQKLTLYDALASCVFHHSDGVVDIKTTPADESLQSDAVTCRKLINAKYCSQFVHMRWKDGSVVHVYVTAEECRQYEEKMHQALVVLQRRIDWLRSGSRELFGNIQEDQLYLLLDTSESMRRHLPWVKGKVHQLIEEQLCQKQRVNMLGFGTNVTLWRDTLTEVSPESLANALHWIDQLTAGGSTNTLDALTLALADEGTQAVYLLMDGRPDQHAKDILKLVRRRTPVPIHTISFNCDDHKVNSFLHELSQQTGGRFLSYFTDVGDDYAFQRPYENEDLQILQTEMEEGRRDLESIIRLRAECVLLDTFHHRKSGTTQRPFCYVKQCSFQRNQGEQQFDQLKSARCAAQTKSSLLRLLSSSGSVGARAPLHRGKVPDQGWLLPESLELFQTNADKQMQVLHRLGKTSNEIRKKKQKQTKPKESLDMSTAEWLKANSLVAKKLTISDAVAPAAIAHDAKYVPMLEKHVYSKVFDEVLHLAHINKGGKQRLTLINPLSVDLEDYKSRLSKALRAFERRLDLIVWRALPQEEKDKFGGEPVAFRERRGVQLEVLERLGWPIAQEELSELEEQIHLGHGFLQQASDLQDVTRQAARDARAATTNSSLKETPPKSQRETPKRPLDYLRGQKVVARSKADGVYYSGIARKRLPGKRVKVDLNSRACEVVALGDVLTVGGSGPCPPLAVADYVLVAARTDDLGDHFVPGVVIATPRRLEAADKLFTILKYNNKEVHTLRNKIIKISQARYQTTCHRLRQIHMTRKTT